MKDPGSLKAAQPPVPVTLYPLCQTLGPVTLQEEGTLRPDLAQYVCQSFTTAELGASWPTILGATTSYDQLSAWLLAYLAQLSIAPYCLALLQMSGLGSTRQYVPG